MANVANLTKSQVTLMFEQRPMPVRKLTRTSGKNTLNIRPHEGTFVSNKSNSSFIAKAKLHPKLITGTSIPNTRKKAESDITLTMTRILKIQKRMYGWKKQQSLSSQKKVKYDLNKLYYALL